MADRAAVDSNVLVYAVAGRGSKRDAARAAIAAARVVPAQALNETAHVLRRKAGMTLPEVAAALDVIRAALRVVPLAETTHALALEVAGETGYSIWDASILAAAVEAGCDRLASEDMQDGRTVRGVTIQNPFVGGRDRGATAKLSGRWMGCLSYRLAPEGAGRAVPASHG